MGTGIHVYESPREIIDDSERYYIDDKSKIITKLNLGREECVGYIEGQKVTVDYGRGNPEVVEAALDLRDLLWKKHHEPDDKAIATKETLIRHLDNQAHTSRLATRLRQTRQDFVSAT